MPAITACLMVSVLLISIAMWSFGSHRPNAFAIDVRVSEPFSRTTNGSCASAVIGMRLLPASAWCGGATIT